jgi:hypothetical protein
LFREEEEEVGREEGDVRRVLEEMEGGIKMGMIKHGNRK